MKLPPSFKPLSSEPRILKCFACGSENESPINAITLLCLHCGRPVDLSDYEVDTFHSRSIQTYGEVYVGVRGKYHGSKLVAGRLIVHGTLDAPYEAHEMVLGKVAHLTSYGSQHSLHVLSGSRIKLQQVITAREAFISGFLETIGGLRITGTIVIRKGATLIGKVEAHAIKVEKGGRYEGQIVIEGHASLLKDDANTKNNR